MCGIVGTFGHDCVNRAWRQYKKQEVRGQDGYGFLALKDSRIVDFQRSTTEAEIKVALKKTEKLEPDTVLFHHRFPTSTINTVNGAHPLPIQHKDWAHKYYMLHNGVVHKHDAEEEIAKTGYTFLSRVEEVKLYRAGNELLEFVESSEVNDSEILGFYVAEYLEGERKDIPMHGAIAAIVVQEDIKTGVCSIYLMRNVQNPLKMHRHKSKHSQSITIASEVDDAVMIDAGKVWRINPATLSLVDYKTVAIGSSSYQGTYYDYPEDGYMGVGFKAYEREKNSPPEDVPARTRLPLPYDDAVIDKERERLKAEADKAWAELEEAKEMLKGDDSVDGELWLKELEDAAEDIEDELQALTE